MSEENSDKELEVVIREFKEAQHKNKRDIYIMGVITGFAATVVGALIILPVVCG